MHLASQLERVAKFFDPRNLLQRTVKYDGPALLVIDVQKEFCDPKGWRGNASTAEVSKRIQSAVPAFRKAGIPVYAIYFSHDKSPKKPEEIDFFEFQPDNDDILVAKDHDSAFRGSNISRLLRKNRHRSLIACGFNASACVKRTVLDAVKAGFDVSLLSDLTGNDNHNPASPRADIEMMREKGVTVTTSDQIIQKVNAAPLSVSI